MTSDSLKVSTMEQGVDPLTQHALSENLINHLEFKYSAIAGGQHIFVNELEVNLSNLR